MANPPYLEPGRAIPTLTPGKAAATIEGEADLAAWVRFALAMVRPKGSVTFIHRADRIDALLAEIAGRAGEVVVYPLWPAAGKPAVRILVRASRAPPPPSWHRGLCCTSRTGSLPRPPRGCCARAGGLISDLPMENPVIRADLEAE